MSLDERFQIISNLIRTFPIDGPLIISDDIKLKMYALFKQATVGDNCIEKPFILNMKERKKWYSWNDLKNKDKDSSKLEYIQESKKVIKEAISSGRYSNVDLKQFQLSPQDLKIILDYILIDSN